MNPFSNSKESPYDNSKTILIQVDSKGDDLNNFRC